MHSPPCSSIQPLEADRRIRIRARLETSHLDPVTSFTHYCPVPRVKVHPVGPSSRLALGEKIKNMWRFVFGAFITLHGLVHLLYFGQSRRIFELPGLAWPDGSWAFSKLLGVEATRLLASTLLVLATLGFVAGGAGVLLGQTWWRPLIVVSAVLSGVIFAVFWDGVLQKLPDKGAIALLINLAILVAVLIVGWPAERHGSALGT